MLATPAVGGFGWTEVLPWASPLVVRALYLSTL